MAQRLIDKELDILKVELLRMGGMVEKLIAQSMRALKERNPLLAHETIDFEPETDTLEITIYEHCIRLLALHHPEATDLRFITVALLINNDLERIGDLAVNICERVVELTDKPLVKPLVDLPALTDLTRFMVASSLQAFTLRDADLARSIRVRDDEVDTLRDSIQNELVAIMKRTPATIDQALPLLLIARHLERICDHATNICEDVIYLVEAQVVRHQKPQSGG